MPLGSEICQNETKSSICPLLHEYMNRTFLGQCTSSLCLESMHRIQGLGVTCPHIHIPDYRKIKICEHIKECRHEKVQVFPFYKLLSDNIIERRQKENYFIQLFKHCLNSLT